MNAKITNFINTSKSFVKKHSPEILTGIGVAGMFTTTVLAVKATPKAIRLLEEAENAKGEELTTIETVKAAWKPYIPAVITGLASASCIIGASRINAKRNAALATAYTISERALVRYRDKVIETIGEKKEKEIKEKIAQDEIDKNPVSNNQVYITSKGNTLCMDFISGRYFMSDIDTIKNAVNEINREMTYEHYVSLNEFYSKIGLDHIKNGYDLGWNLDNGLVELEFTPLFTEKMEPCVGIDYSVSPKYDYNKFA